MKKLLAVFLIALLSLSMSSCDRQPSPSPETSPPESPALANDPPEAAKPEAEVTEPNPKPLPERRVFIIDTSLKDHVPTAEQRAAYDEYFSEIRDFDFQEAGEIDGYMHSVENNRIYKAPFDMTGDGGLLDGENLREYIETPPVKKALVFDESIVYLSENGDGLYTSDLNGNGIRQIVFSDDPIQNFYGNTEMLFYLANDTLYRYHVASGITDKGGRFEGKDMILWPYTNDSLSVKWSNPNYDAYVQETGIDDGTNMFIMYIYYFSKGEKTLTHPELASWIPSGSH